MASKTMLLLFATVLLFTARASSLDDHEELAIKFTYGNAPAPQPLHKAPAPSPLVVKAPSPPLAKPPCPPLAKPPSPPYTKPPSPVSPPVKPPTPVSPPVMPPTYPPLPRSDCVPLCEKRCMQHRKKRMCMRACTACCDRCRCVPPGTFGNEEKCGQCYTDIVIHGIRTKCP